MSCKPGKKKFSNPWMQRHVQDHYVQKSVKEGYRSRASFKILQIHEKDKLFKHGQSVIDLGAAPGGWSQVISKLVGPAGQVIAIDRLPMDPILGVHIIEGDFLTEETLNAIIAISPTGKVDWIVSDLSPNLSGLSAIDQPRMMALAEATLELADTLLKPKGGILLKVFQGSGFSEFHRTLQQRFDKVQTRKPDASRDESREIYLLGRGFRAM